MGILEIFKLPYKGKLSNSKLKLKDSIIISIILACAFGIATIISGKVLVEGLSRGLMGSIIEKLFNEMLLRVFILVTINFVGIILGFSAIIYVISKIIFKLEATYEEVLSTSAYATIIPTSIMLIGVLFSLFSATLTLMIIIIQIIVLIILTYEGLSSLMIVGKSRVISSVAVTYIINIVLFRAINSLYIESMIKSSLGRFF